MSNNRKSGGAYDYISEREWLKADKVGNFKLLDAISNKALNTFKPFVLEENRNVKMGVKEILGELDVGRIERKTNNRNRQNIETTLRDEESSMIIKDLIGKKEKMEEQAENIEEVLNKNLDTVTYAEFLRNPSSKSKKFTFKNITVNGDIPGSTKGLEDYGDKVMKKLPDIENENIQKRIKKDEDYIKYSISSGMSWKYVDLNKHGIGTPKDIMEFAVKILNNEDTSFKPKDLKNTDIVKKIYGSYLGNKEDEFINSIEIPGFRMPTKGDDEKIIYYDTSISSEDSLIDSSSYPSGTIKQKIDECIKVINSPDKDTWKKGIAREFLVVLFYELMYQVIENLKRIAGRFKKYAGKYSQQYKNIIINIETLRKLIYNSMIFYFDLDNKDISVYGVDKATRDRSAKPSSSDTSIFRVVGGWERIMGLDKFTNDTYPLFGNDGEIVSKLIKMLDAAPEKDIADKSTLAMGGFIQNDFIGRMSIKITHDYFQELIKNKELNAKYIDTILTKMRRGVHMKDLKSIRDRIETKLKDIGKTSDKTTKTIRVKAAAQALAKEYKRLRNYELDNLLSLDMIESTIKNNPNKMAIIGKKIVKLRDESLTKFGHYQLKSRAYKTLALGAYRQLMELNKHRPDTYPSQYIGVIQDALNRVDNDILKELSGKAKGKYEVLRDRMLSKVVERDITGPLNTAISIKPTNVGRNSVGRNSVGRNSVGRNYNNIVNYNTELTAYNWKEIESKDFWVRAKKRLDGLTIYIPFVDISVMDLGHQHGLFDLINAAIEGKIIESLVISRAADHIIPGSKLDRSTISRRVRAQGTVMVTNGESEIRDIRKWRCMIKGEIREMKKLGAADLRRKIFNILSNKAQYQMDTPYLWPNSSYTKEKIVLYCGMTHGKDLSKCALLSSRNRVAGKIQ